MVAFTRPTKLPEWASGDAADIVEPTAGEKAQGWVAGTPDNPTPPPPAPYFNWLMGGDFGYFPWLQYVSTFEQQALTWPERQTFQKGFAASGQRSTIVGLDVTGGATVAGGVGVDSLTASGQISAESASLASATVSATAQVGTLKTANFAPVTPAGTITLPGNMTLTGGTATLTATTVSATLGNFSADVVSGGTFRGNLEVVTPQTFGVTTGATFLNSWTQVTAGQSYYQLDRTGRLWIYLEDVYGGTVGAGTPIFTLPTLPVFMRPNRNYKFPTSRFVVSPTGTLFLYVTTGGSVYVQDSGGSLNSTTLGSPGFTANVSMLLIR